MLAGLSTNDTIAKIREENEALAEKKRLELAGAITRTVVNQALAEMRERKRIFEETKGQENDSAS